MVKTVDVLGVPHAYELTEPTHHPDVLVFIHGWLLSRGYWQPLIQQLAPTYQCLSYDLRGFGDSHLGRSSELRPSQSRSNHSPHPLSELTSETSRTAVADPPHTSYSPAAYAQDLIILLQQLGIQRAWLVGHSLGGSIGLWAADQHPDCIKGVICVNSGGGIYLKEEFERFRSAGEQLIKLRPSWLCHLPLVDLVMTRMNVARPIARSWGRQRLLDLVTAHPEAALGALLDSTTEEEVHCLPQVVSRLKQPVYFIAGAEDTIMEPQYVRHLASFHHLFRFCGDNVTEIPNCGHLAMVEQPELVSKQIYTILNQHP
ncbi:MAG TPA: alpha/beta hydrolase [Crinalium sp.]|jgi:pimeloyl-ACP methyl ester carboxylesterase